MLTAAGIGRLELRAAENGGARIVGRFPYNTEAELARGRREVFAPGALEPRADVLLLAQHDMGRPLASIKAGTLELRNEPEGLTIEATVTPEIAATSHGADALALIRSGLAAGLSPGFRVRPGGERIEGRGGGVLRTVSSAELHEVSIVTRPAFDMAQVEARSWRPEQSARPMHHTGRWR